MHVFIDSLWIKKKIWTDSLFCTSHFVICHGEDEKEEEASFNLHSMIEKVDLKCNWGENGNRLKFFYLKMSSSSQFRKRGEMKNFLNFMLWKMQKIKLFIVFARSSLNITIEIKCVNHGLSIMSCA